MLSGAIWRLVGSRLGYAQETSEPQCFRSSRLKVQLHHRECDMAVVDALLFGWLFSALVWVTLDLLFKPKVEWVWAAGTATVITPICLWLAGVFQ